MNGCVGFLFQAYTYRKIGLIFALCLASAAQAQIAVTTWHNDAARDGANTRESILTPANVGGQGTFGEIFSVSVDGLVTAQPLYLSGLNIAGGSHNVVFVATQHDSVYAIDASNGAVLWKRSFLGPGMTSVPSSLENCPDLAPEIGITGTPAIDSGTGTLYAVSATMPGPIQQLHAIDVSTGQDKFGGPVTVSASVAGTGAGSTGGIVSFNAKSANQRSALLLTGDHLLIAWASHCDHDAYHGWFMSYNAGTLSQETVFNSTPNGSDGGIWMAGSGPSADVNGNIFFSTGNGDFGGYTSTEFGDSMLRMAPPVAGKPWQPVDGFTPWNQSTFKTQDNDLGSGGVVLLPDLPSGAQHRQLAIEGIKDGEIVVVDRNSMGKYCATCGTVGEDTNIVQEVRSQLIDDSAGTPAYWNGTLYFGERDSPLKAFSFNTTTGAISTTAIQTATYTFGPEAPTPTVSSNGNADGIVWILDSSLSSTEVLLAYDATNLSHVLYQYSIPSPGSHFAVPTVANGMVYAGSKGTLTAFGLLNARNTTPPVTLTFAKNPIAAHTPLSYTVVVGAGTAGQPNPVGTITLYGYLANGQLIRADGPHPIGSAGTAGVSTFSNTIAAGIPAGQYRVYATFQPASGSTYTTANSPQVVEIAQ